jgi:hypothetical protein
MTARVVEPPRDAALAWMRESLRDGHAVSSATLAAAPFDQGRFRAVVSGDTPEERVSEFRFGGVADAGRGADADAALAQLLAGLARRGGSCVVIESDVWDRLSPALARVRAPSAFIGDRVVHWADLEPADEAIRTTYASASGYPRNAFIVRKSCAELGLVDGKSLDASFAGEVTTSLLAVLVAAYDAESFLVWEAGA